MRLAHIGLTCADLDRSEKFYSDLFGFKTFFRIRRQANWLDARVGYKDTDIEFCHMRGLDGLHLELLKYWNPSSGLQLYEGTYMPGHMHFSIEVDNAHETACRVIDWMHVNNKGSARFAPQPLDIEASEIPDGPQKGGKGFYMRDPDGHSIEITQAAPKAEIDEIIDSIQEIRAKNNILHCDLIRLCYKVAKDETAAIFRQIEKNDAEITALGKRSAAL